MAHTTIKNISQLQIEGAVLQKFLFGETQIALLFSGNKQMDINNFWELYEDGTAGVIDKGLSLKFREKLLLYRLIGKKCVKVTKDPFFIEIYFDGGLRLVVHKGNHANAM